MIGLIVINGMSRNGIKPAEATRSAHQMNKPQPDRDLTMLIRSLLLAAVIATSATPVIAQSGHADDRPMATSSEQGREPSRKQNSGDSRGPSADRLNGDYAQHYRMRSRIRAQMRDDQLAYRSAVMAQHRYDVDQYHRRYARREMAYGRSMAAWRMQVAACHHGDHKACRSPTPRVADFY